METDTPKMYAGINLEYSITRKLFARSIVRLVHICGCKTSLSNAIMVALIFVTSVSAGSVSDKRGIGISNGYGGAYKDYGGHFRYRYSATASVDKDLQTGLATSSGYGGTYGYLQIPIDKVANTNLKKVDSSIPSSIDGVFNNSPFPNPVNINRGLQPTHTTSSENDEVYVNPAISKVTNFNRDLDLPVPISSGYGGAYSYNPLSSNVNINKGLKFKVIISSGDGRAAGNPVQSNVASINRDFLLSIPISSGYGGAYGYVPTQSVASADKFIELPMLEEMTHTPKEHKLKPMSAEDSHSSGYSGYGRAFSKYSGYSRYPGYAGYGFAYAGGWL